MFEPELKPETAQKLELWRKKNGKRKSKLGRLPKPEGPLTPKQIEDREAHKAAVARLNGTE